ncbi:hypothetical protein EIP91_011624 [Steccherinum ochraceum]|uniref:Zn(2)-C6 fungal-type domain-containing protein n=1 Tax=Steccherinum ochraceum TaxID=92696 RepID=A0A4R0RLY5_9APHY|nr:hypothetical protein EIP91_011624 [Steccherinum ochraceum]
MPAERPESRRTSRKLISDEEIELKRAKGEISCAECRRLKLKCDKKLPCGSCTRRGCTTICPNGSLSAGQGTRFVLADTEQLHNKIGQMSERIRQLEDALSISQSGASDERHPLLRDDLLSIKYGLEVRRPNDDEHLRKKMSSTIDTLGTLTLGEHGETKFIGRSGGPETWFLDAAHSIGESSSLKGQGESERPKVEDDFDNLAFTFPLQLPIAQDGVNNLLRRLECELPPQTRAWELCETYLSHFAWWFRPIKRDELLNDVASPIYRYAGDMTSNEGYRGDVRCPHLLAVLYLALAVGALVDLALPPCSAEAEKYYRLGRAALSLKSVFDSPEVETIEALALMSAYHSLCSTRHTTESAWSLISLAARLSHSVGLHRDSSKWGLEPRIVERRRNLFWEVYLFEGVHCNLLGRPPGLSRMHTDVDLPSDEEQGMDEAGRPIEGYWHWKLGFQQSIVNYAHDILLNTETPQYEVILSLDRRLRQATIPDVKLFPKPEDDDYSNASLSMQGALISQIRSIGMIGLHRTFFTQALLDHPANPLKSPYAPSFLAATRCASVVINSFLYHGERSLSLYGRFWSMWTHAFTACVILGSTVTRCPTAAIAASSLMELESAVEMFKRGSQYSLRARQAVPMLEKLRNQATYVYQQYRDRHILPSPDSASDLGPDDNDGDSKLAMFGGKVKVLSNGFADWSRAKRSSPRRESPFSDSRDVSPRAGSEGASSVSESSARQELHQPFDIRDYMFNSPSAMKEAGRPLIVPSMATPSPSSAPPLCIPSYPTPYTQYHHPHTGPASYPPDPHHIIPSPSSVYGGVPNLHYQNASFSGPSDHSRMDPNAWYAALTGTYVSEFTDSASLYPSNHATSNQQWMNLMRDTGMFDQTAPQPRPTGGDVQPESIPESINMIF